MKGYKLYDLEKETFVISRNVKFFEDRFDHFDDNTELVLPSSFYLEVDEEVQVVPENPLPEILVEPDGVEPVGAHLMQEIPIELESAEPVGVQENANAEDSIRRVTVRNIGPVRQRRAPNKYADEDCLLVDSLTSDIDEPKSVEEAMNGEHSVQWREAMDSGHASLLENDTWELVPPPEGTNIVGSRWVLRVK